MRSQGGLERLELNLYDWKVRMKAVDADGDGRIVLVTVTEADIQRLGHWPLSDATLAEAITRIAAGRPRALGVDIYRDVSVSPGSDHLQEVLESLQNVVFIMKFAARPEARVPPPAALIGTEQSGFSDMVVDADGIVRRAALFLDDGETVFYALALRLALLYLEGEGIYPQPGDPNPHHLRLGAATLPPFEASDGGYVQADARGYQILLDYGVSAKKFVSVSLTDVLTQQAPSEIFTDRIVLLGVTAETVKDYFFTPLHHRKASDQPMSGVALHAQVVSYLLRLANGDIRPVRSMSPRMEKVWIFWWTLLGAAGGYAGSSLRRLMGLVIVGLLLLWGAIILAFDHAYWIPGAPPALGFLITAGLMAAFMVNLEKQRWATLRNLFGRYVSDEVAEAVWQDRQQLFSEGQLRPQRLTATVLFSDLVGFSRVAERMRPAELINWLNQVMEAMTTQVVGHQGFVNKYIGDAIMAVFGAPLARTSESERERDAVNAVACALAMQRALVDLNQRWQAEGLPLIGARIGIFTGDMTAGSLGSTERLEYTVIGDAVNAASRLESYASETFTPDYFQRPCRILIGEDTFRRLAGRFSARRHTDVVLKGMQQKFTVYEIWGKVRNQGRTGMPERGMKPEG